jgi:hypothetical protein
MHVVPLAQGSASMAPVSFGLNIKMLFLKITQHATDLFFNIQQSL